jgi:hypothetical protein
MTNRLLSRTRLLRAIAAVLVLAGCTGSEPAWAEVNGHTYEVGPVRGLRISERVLDYFGSVGRTNSEDFFLDGEAFTIRDVDPHTLLVVRAVPALRNDADDSWGDYVGLWGGVEDPDLCAYAEASAVTFCE